MVNLSGLNFDLNTIWKLSENFISDVNYFIAQFRFGLYK